MNRKGKLLLLATALFLISACTTQKSRDDLSLIGKAWHNTTAHYNGYFNAEELLMASIEELKQQNSDNYNKILNVYEYIEVDNPQAVASNLDEAIKKVTVVVNLHRQSYWTDDCYLLVGQAQYLKQDYEAAEETFRYLIEEYNPARPSKSKKLSPRSKSSRKKSTSASKKSNAKTSKQKSLSAKKKRAAVQKQKKKEKKAKEKERAAYNRQVKKNRKKGIKPPPRPSSKKKAEETAAPKPDTKIAEANTAKSDQKEEEIKDKEAEKITPPNSYFMKHKPSYQEGVLWLAKTLIERDNYDGALRYMAQLDADQKTFKEVRSELAPLQAYFLLKRKDYQQAIVQLEEAVELASKKENKARYSFIIAQLYQQDGKGDKAYTAYEQTLKHGPDFEMAFRCKLNMAQNAWLSGKGSSEEAKKNLARMLKDQKNLDFQDQIYYALAQIALQENNREEAIKNLELSLRNSRQNRTQKAESYYTLATLYFETEDFVPAKNYFDSTLQVLAVTDERYNEVRGFSDNLTEIAANLKTISLQDSLLRLSELSPEEKKAIAAQIRQKEQEEKRRQLAEKANAASNTQNRFNKATVGGGAGALKPNSTFFAYDDKDIKRGKREFSRKWNSRLLEDDWRRSNRQSSIEFTEEEVLEEFSDFALTDEEVDKILGAVPKTDKEKASANLLIREAMFSLGSLYRERLDNNNKSVEILEELNRRYPESSYELDSWYFLYLAYSDLKNTGKTKEYFDKITSKYPSSTYALVLQDPDYAKKMLDDNQKLNIYYNDAYSDFTNGRYQQAFDKSNQAKEKFGATNTLQPRFALLSALCMGNLKGKDAYINSLKEIIARYPKTEEQTRAREILRLLGETGASLPGEKEEVSADFKVEEDKLHYILIVFNKEDISLTDNKATVSDFNKKYHKLEKLRISNIYLGTDVKTPIIVIRRFQDKAAVMKYYDGLQKNPSDFINSSVGFEVFPVTQNNYRQILRTKTLDGYRTFFENNYLK